MIFKDNHFMEALYVVFVAGCLLVLSSCAHDPKMDRKIADEVQQQPVIPQGQPMLSESEEVIEESPLSPKQKQALADIAEEASVDMKLLRDQDSKLRLLLIKKLVSPQATNREVEAIKKRILEVNTKNNKRWLKAVDDAKKVIGRRTEQDEKFFRIFMANPPTRTELN